MAGEISLPVLFIPNHGLADPQFRYVVQTPHLDASFAPDSVVFQLLGSQIELHFSGANPDVEIAGTGDTGGHANFFTGQTPDHWRTALPMFSEIRYRDLYPGIELAYRGSGRRPAEIGIPREAGRRSGTHPFALLRRRDNR